MRKLLTILITTTFLLLISSQFGRVLAEAPTNEISYEEKYFQEIQKGAENAVNYSNTLVEVMGVMVTIIGIVVIVQVIRNEAQLRESNKILQQIKDQKKETEGILEAFKTDTKITENLAREIQDYFQKAKKDYEYISKKTNKIKKDELIELLVNKRSDSIGTSSSSIDRLIRKLQ